MTKKERGITVSRNIFILFILLVCILLVFIRNACSFFYPVEEEEYKILVLIVVGIFKIAKRALKRKNVGIGMN